MDRKNLKKNSLPLVIVAGAFVSMLATGCSSYTEPEWTSVAKVEGKSYVTDDTMAIDMQLIEVSQPPNTQSAADWFKESIFSNMRADNKENFKIGEIKESSDPGVAVTPGDLKVQDKYVSYLRGRLGSDHDIGFWQAESTDPLVIMVDGQPVGAVKLVGQ